MLMMKLTWMHINIINVGVLPRRTPKQWQQLRLGSDLQSKILTHQLFGYLQVSVCELMSE